VVITAYFRKKTGYKIQVYLACLNHITTKVNHITMVLVWCDETRKLLKQGFVLTWNHHFKNVIVAYI